MENNTEEFSHVDAQGNASMVDISHKSASHRVAKARSIVELGEKILKKMESGELHMPKGPVFQTATLAGTMAVKQTGFLIPLCHPLQIEKIHFNIETDDHSKAIIECTVATTGKTGVEMEALTGASVAALTMYDMCKAISHHIIIEETRLIQKSGGKRDFKLE